MLSTRITAFLNAGDTVVAEVPAEASSTRCFVRIRPQPKPGVPREERRYLNSTWSMWEYWDFEFRRLTLHDGWQSDEWNYDRYAADDQRLTTVDEPTFQRALRQWVPDVGALTHITESQFPE